MADSEFDSRMFIDHVRSFTSSLRVAIRRGVHLCLRCANRISWTEVNTGLAEEAGVEPTKPLFEVSTALKAARPTGDDALPWFMLSAE